MKNYKGITLIALVVTVVVLLILAGVSIATLTGDSGIITQAQKAKEETHNGEDRELIEIAVVQYELEPGVNTYADFFEKLDWCEDATYDETTKTTLVEIKDCKHKYIVYENGNIEKEVKVSDSKGISLDKTQILLQLKIGQTVTEEITATLKEITGEIIWSIEDETIATLSNTTGNSVTITAISDGTTTITAKCGDYSTTCKVTVLEASPEVAITVATRNIDTAIVTVDVSNREESEIQEYKYYIKLATAEDSEYIETTGDGNTCTFIEVDYTQEYIVKVEVTDTRGSVGTATTKIGTWCFVAGTQVLTETGMKNIEDIKIGDKVYAINLDTNQKELKEVTFLYKGVATETYEITIGNEIVEATPKHQFYIVDKGWVRAYDLEEGDRISAKDDTSLEITNIELKHHEEPINIYNITVDVQHNYLITEYELLVHNAGSK